MNPNVLSQLRQATILPLFLNVFPQPDRSAAWLDLTWRDVPAGSACLPATVQLEWFASLSLPRHWHCARKRAPEETRVLIILGPWAMAHGLLNSMSPMCAYLAFEGGFRGMPRARVAWVGVCVFGCLRGKGKGREGGGDEKKTKQSRRTPSQAKELLKMKSLWRVSERFNKKQKQKKHQNVERPRLLTRYISV